MIDQNTNSSFLANAILHAKKNNAHKYYSEPTLAEDQRQQKKRLWWSCILRDRILALGVRRPILITPNEFDFGQECLTEADFVDEMDKSHVYTATTKRQLVNIIALQCQLAVAVTPLVIAVYPILYSSTPIMSPVSQFIQSMARVEESKTELAVWARRSGITLTNRDARDIPPSDAHESVTLYTELTCIYYLYVTRQMYIFYKLLTNRAKICSNRAVPLLNIGPEEVSDVCRRLRATIGGC